MGGYTITVSAELTKERSNNWHCRIQPMRKTDDTISIDVWGHNLDKAQTEKIAKFIKDKLTEHQI